LAQTLDEDDQLQNSGVYTAWRKAKDRDIWRQVINQYSNALTAVCQEEEEEKGGHKTSYH